MNKIEQLLQKYCPDGVEFKELSKIAEVSWAWIDKKIIDWEQEITLLNYMDVYRNHYIDWKIPKMKVTANDNKIKQCNVLKGDIFITPSSEVKNEIWFSALAIEDMPWVVYSYHIMRIRLSEYNYTQSMFINYLFRSDFLQDKINKQAKWLTRFWLTKTQWEKIQIPIPPIEIQKEIVKILDTFTELETELETEQEARKKQYEYYRDDLLSFGDHEMEWKILDEVCLSINAGWDLPKKYLKGQKEPTEEFPYPIYSNWTDSSALYGFTDSYKIDNEAVTISARGTIGYHTIRNPKFTPIVRLITCIPNNQIITTKFLNYILYKTEIWHSGWSIPQLTTPNVKKLKIPVPFKNWEPDLEKQQEIVAVLDKFDALVNDISVGLPAEIQARRQQYEYYRERLLTFKELKK
jgi:type I restriction enzyme, S subunit